MARHTLFGAVAVVAVVSVVAGLLLGTYPVTARELVQSLVHGDNSPVRDVIWELRAPRVLAAFACGALLAFAGALLQVLLRNALADPYILGVSSGASLGALLALVLGAGPAAVNASALASAFAAIVLVFGLGFRSGDPNPYRLLLTGVVLATGLSALVSLVLVVAPQAQVKGMLYWLMGDLAYADGPAPAWIAVAAVLAIAMTNATRLDLLALGRTKARALGLAVAPLQIAVFGAAALATVMAVMLGGAIGFVGLMAPHAIRLLGVANHRALLPLAMLLGGAFLTLADTAARTVWAPQQLPVGVLTALIGVPAMLFLLGRKR
jgi:iron complex transport system permease protein